MQPVLFRGSVRAASGKPQCVGERRDFFVPECGNAVSCHGSLRMPMRLFGVFQGLPGMLVSGQVLLFVVLLLGGAMSVCGDVV